MAEIGDAHFTRVDGRPAIDFGDASLYLLVEWNANRGQVRQCLRDFRDPPIRMSSWITTDDITDVWSSHKAAIIREEVRAEYGDLWRRKLDRVIHVFQEERNNFIIETEVTEETPQTQEVAEEIPLTPEEEEEVLLILTSPDGLEHVRTHLDNVIAGEDDKKVLIFLLLLSGKTNWPQMILIKGDPGAGKTTLMLIADLYNTKDVGRFTKHALDYSDLEGFEILRLKEFGQMDAEEQGVSTIKFLSADDKGYVVEYPMRDPETGELRNMQKLVRPITVISSTTRVSVDPQFERRAWLLSPDQTEAQTERIRQWIIRHETEKELVSIGRLVETSYDRSMRILRAVINRIQQCDVMIPFKDYLTAVINRRVNSPIKRPQDLRIRGDYTKLMTLIKLTGVFYQSLLPCFTINDGEEEKRQYVMTPEKALEALTYALPALETMAADVDERIIEVLEALSINRVTQKGYPITVDLRKEIARHLGKASDTIYRYCERLERAGYLTSRKDGRDRIYELRFDMDTIMRTIHEISGKLRNPISLISQMREEAQNFLNTHLGFRISQDSDYYISEYLAPFFDENIISQSPSIRDPTSDVSNNMSGNSQIRDNIPESEESRDNRADSAEPQILCYLCRRDITEERQFHRQVDDRDVLVCAECYGEERRVLLSERLQMLRDILDDVYHDSQDLPVTASTILMYLEERFPDDLWTGGTLQQVIRVAIRDGILFEPRPGFYMRT